MRIEEHPFQVLGITSQSSRREILARGEALNGKVDSEAISACRVQVTHPMRRIDAEVSWFPQVGTAQLCQLITVICEESTTLDNLKEQFSNLDCIGRLNALSYWLEARQRFNRGALQVAMTQIGSELASVNGSKLIARLNLDRAAACLPEITDESAVASAITRRGRIIAHSLARRLSSHATEGSSQVLGDLVEREAANANSQIPTFISNLVDHYEIEIQVILQKSREEICGLCSKVLAIAQLQSAPGGRIASVLASLAEKISLFGGTCRPIQLVRKSQGRRDELTLQIMSEVRGMCVTLANEYGMHEEAEHVTRSLLNACEPVAECSEALEDDLHFLEALIKEKTGKKQEEMKRGQVARSASAGAGTTGSGNIWPTAASATGQSGVSFQRADVERFVEHCRHIRASCTLVQFESPSVFYKEYCDSVPSWLNILCVHYAADRVVLKKVKTAAVECLCDLARSFSAINDFQSANRLASEALLLVADDQELAAKVKDQLREIEAKKAGNSSAPQLTPAKGERTRPDAARENEGSAQRGTAFAEAKTKREQTKRPTPAAASSSLKGRRGPLSGRPLWFAGAPVAILLIGFILSMMNDSYQHFGEHHEATTEQRANGDIFDQVAQRNEEGHALTTRPPSKLPPTGEFIKQAEPSTPVGRPNGQLSSRNDQLNPDSFMAVHTESHATDPSPTVSAQPAADVDPPPFSLPNGENLLPIADASGLGKFKISNRDTLDVVVKLKRSGDRSTLRCFYVRGMSNVSISGIPAGSYLLQFATGTDWDVHGQSFRRDQSFAALDKTLSFSEDPVEGGTMYSTHLVTLHTASDGNTQKVAISASQFYDGDGR